MSDRESVRRRLVALMSMTVERGASEAEAMAAATKAAALMREHGLTYQTVDDVEADQYRVERRPWFRGRAGRQRAGRVPATRYCLPAIAKLCSVDFMWSAETGKLAAFGTDAEVRTAFYFVDIIGNAIEREFAMFRKRATRPPDESPHKWGQSFRVAMALRIAARLNAMVPADEVGTGIVELRNANRAAEFERRFNTKDAPASKLVIGGAAAAAGWDAGERVDLHDGVDQSVDRDVKRIGGR